MKSIRKHPLLFGTLLLTVTGLISRLIGFFYRIYLSRTFGEEGMGLYQLLSPILSLSFSITAAGYQTAISKLVAEQCARKQQAGAKVFFAGLSFSLPLSLLINALLYHFAPEIALHFLKEPRTTELIRILSFCIVPGAIHACANGYFYGRKKAAIPACSQLAEQLIRTGSIYILSARCLREGRHPDIRIAVIGLLIGECLSMLLSAGAFSFSAGRETRKKALQHAMRRSDDKNFTFSHMMRQVLTMALPLTANRLVLNFLQSVESVSIPAKLRLYGYDTQAALSIYGVLTGMAMPLIFFPNALTSSISILLLPTISEQRAAGNLAGVKETIHKTLRACGLLGLLCMFFFVFFGSTAGRLLFKSPLAGHFIQTLGFIAPFLYLDTTLSGILQGLGMAGRLFLLNLISLSVRLAFVLFLVPIKGIQGYLWGLLVSQGILTILYLVTLHYAIKKASRV
jgi:stage V sporulation protein B